MLAIVHLLFRFGQMHDGLIHHHSTVHNKKHPMLHLFTLSSLLTLQPVATMYLFTVSLVFPECHRVGIILYTAFSDWPLSLRNFSFPCHFMAGDPVSLSCCIRVQCLDVLHLLSLTSWRTTWLLPFFWHYA
jgi:hypothetical protein